MTNKIIATAALVAGVATSTAAQDCVSQERKKVAVIEIVQFRLANGVDRRDFIAAATETMSVLCATDGFLGRSLTEGQDGSWTDYVKWTDMKAAEAAMAASMENAALLPFIQSIDPDSISLSYQVPVVLE